MADRHTKILEDIKNPPLRPGKARRITYVTERQEMHVPAVIAGCEGEVFSEDDGFILCYGILFAKSIKRMTQCP